MAPYLGNLKSNEFHDLANQKAQCQISEILTQKFFTPDTAGQAVAEGFEPCFFCIGTFADLGLSPLGAPITSPSDLTGQDAGAGMVLLEWTYADDIEAQKIAFDLFSSPDPLDPFRTLRAGNLKVTSALIPGFAEGGHYYFTVIAKRGGPTAFLRKRFPFSFSRSRRRSSPPPEGAGRRRFRAGSAFRFRSMGPAGSTPRGAIPCCGGRSSSCS
ncbi:MAG: fibronectin type III domain-containing protein [Candidatus Manganitrophus sp.]|nr:fibronectin type III domain-containing protein [Candidatus Manganitrophus sp.]WDT70076.1 MAG: fibronectin type III domain-containing protein [Candidatus Manganitrophus sp.]WDT78272.1 MAG: fibronectin type III domain-containing protein [Candidatus Manganitrophus sp.]